MANPIAQLRLHLHGGEVARVFWVGNMCHAALPERRLQTRGVKHTARRPDPYIIMSNNLI